MPGGTKRKRKERAKNGDRRLQKIVKFDLIMRVKRMMEGLNQKIYTKKEKMRREIE